jgi:hypothetical protein
MSLTEDQIKILDPLYKDPSKGLLTAPALNKYLKDNNYKGFTVDKIKNYLNSLQTTQTSKLEYSQNSYTPEHPLDQFQIDLVYMPSSWHNSNYKYLFTCIDIFSKKGDIIPMKKKDSVTSANAFKKMLSNLGIPKTIYSDQGSEFKNAEFQSILDKHNIRIIFTLSHAPFIEVFNKTIKYKLVKYMELNGTKNWLEFLEPVLEAYNNTPHSTTKVAPNKVDKSNEGEIAKTIRMKGKVKTYEDIKVGDKVRLKVVHKVAKGFKQQWSDDLYTVDKDYHDGVYLIDGDLYPRKEIQLVQEDKLIRKPEKTPQQKAVIQRQDRIGKAANSSIVKQLMNTTQPEYEKVTTMVDSTSKTKRSNQSSHNYASLIGKTFRTKKD